MRRLTAAVLFLTFALPLARADEKADAAKKLEGTYEVVSVAIAGKPSDEKKNEVKSFVIKDGTITVTTDRRAEPAKFTLDPSQKPAHIDIFGDKAKEAVKGIYEAKESDKGLELTISFPRKDGAERPKDFKGEGEGVMVVKLLRKKDK